MQRPSPRPPATSFATPEGTLHLGERLGQGLGSEVYVAWLERPHRILKRVAVKLFANPVGHASLEHVERAVRETALANHPNIVEVMDLGTTPSSQAYIVSEMVDGMSLASLLRAYRDADRRMPLELSLFIAIETAEALAAAQCAKDPNGAMIGLAHLDLSARAVLLSFQGEVKVEGFGLAAPIADGSGIRVMRKLAPRLSQMAPEVASGKSRGDARADVFALGVLLSEMLIGPRFPANLNDEEACEMAKTGFVCPDILAPPLAPDLQAILDRTLSRHPHHRQGNAGIVAHDLRAIALKMGVGDTRIFLRNALFEMSEQPPADRTQPDR